VQKSGFLPFWHWREAPGSQTRSAADALLQTVELAQAAEETGFDGAFVRVHHFERQLASPFPATRAFSRRSRSISRPRSAGLRRTRAPRPERHFSLSRTEGGFHVDSPPADCHNREICGRSFDHFRYDSRVVEPGTAIGCRSWG
jgi:hypothetical protein